LGPALWDVGRGILHYPARGDAYTSKKVSAGCLQTSAANVMTGRSHLQLPKDGAVYHNFISFPYMFPDFLYTFPTCSLPQMAVGAGLPSGLKLAHGGSR